MWWAVLFVAGLLEVVWVVCMKLSKGFTRPVPSLCVLVFGGLSLFALCQVVKHIPTGTAYAVWTGIGAVGSCIVGIVLFGEQRSWLRLVSIAFIIAGAVMLKIYEKQ